MGSAGRASHLGNANENRPAPGSLWALNFEWRTVHISTTANDPLSKVKRIQEQTLAFLKERGTS